MKQSDILPCQIQQWYPRFHSVSIRTILLPLPESFIDFLLDDGGLFLPKTNEDEDALPARVKITCPDLQAEDYHPWQEEEEEEEGGGQHPANAATFPDLEKAVKESIKTLGGFVFPKLNWSAPKDTAWISTNGTLKCSSFSEIVLLLKASDSLVHDLCHAFDSCEDKTLERPSQFYLALRKWYDLRPEMEFRGFVKGGVLVGICQREVTGFYPALLEKLDQLEDSIFDFFREYISEKFETLDYAFDCYVRKDGKVKLVDFNPWGGFTLPLLFTWEDLGSKYVEADERINVMVANRALKGDLRLTDKTELNLRLREEGYKLDFRVVESEGCVQPSLRASSGVPYDYIDTGPGSAWDEFLRKADEEIKRQANAAGA
ncbi:uncharacterized protein LOC131079049 [Cryptomeria japonica]|uniref:uncharacterized protein LOC131079049 n=1 Tax=Cryptomeria japonica TaxID=3369 RepID=UPI0027DA98A0|nr:uncharacterized protein LOC131079049 [Cryptomeria japonica]